MPEHDPFSPASAVRPPTSDIAPSAEDATPDTSVLQQSERAAGADDGGGQEAVAEAPQTPETPPAGEGDGNPPETPQGALAPEAPAQEDDPDKQVRAGTTKEVLAWVHEAGDDHVKVRAQAALDAEGEAPEHDRRKGLKRELEELLSDDPASS